MGCKYELKLLRKNCIRYSMWFEINLLKLWTYDFSLIPSMQFFIISFYALILGIIAPLVPGVGLNYESLPVVQKFHGGSLW
jgi:hypothetical protein